jgi:hypothetical protein
MMMGFVSSWVQVRFDDGALELGVEFLSYEVVAAGGRPLVRVLRRDTIRRLCMRPDEHNPVPGALWLVHCVCVRLFAFGKTRPFGAGSENFCIWHPGAALSNALSSSSWAPLG